MQNEKRILNPKLMDRKQAEKTISYSLQKKITQKSQDPRRSQVPWRIILPGVGLNLKQGTSKECSAEFQDYYGPLIYMYHSEQECLFLLFYAIPSLSTGCVGADNLSMYFIGCQMEMNHTLETEPEEPLSYMSMIQMIKFINLNPKMYWDESLGEPGLLEGDVFCMWKESK